MLHDGNTSIRKKIGLLGSIVLMQLKDTSRKFIFNTKLSTQQFRAIIKVKILQEILQEAIIKVKILQVYNL